MSDVKRILFPSDFSQSADIPAANAAALAQRLDAELTVLHVSLILENDQDGSVDLGPLDKPTTEVLAEMHRQLAPTHYEGQVVEYAQTNGITAGPAIVDYLEQYPHDLVIMGTHGRRGFKRWLMGSVAEEVVRFAPCPVITLKEDWVGSLADVKRILVPLDFSLASAPALARAHAMADRFGASLEILHVIQPPPYPDIYAFSTTSEFYKRAQEKSEMLIGRLLAEFPDPVPTITNVVTGYPTHEILNTAQSRGVDLILMAHLGLTRMAGRKLGSVTEHVVRTAHCPVLTAELGAP